MPADLLGSDPVTRNRFLDNVTYAVSAEDVGGALSHVLQRVWPLHLPCVR